MDIVLERCAGIDVHKNPHCCGLPAQAEQLRRACRSDTDVRDDDRRVVAALRLAERRRLHPRRHREHRRLLAARPQSPGGVLRGLAAERPAHQGRPRQENGRARRAVDRRAPAPRPGAPQLHPAAPPARAARADAAPLTFVQQRATLSNRVQKVLEGANIKLAAVVSDVLGVSARAMIAAIAAGTSDPAVLAELARGSLCKKREALAAALSGRVRAHHRFLLTELLAQLDAVDETIARFDDEIHARARPTTRRQSSRC